jgi:hypothetical protein
MNTCPKSDRCIHAAECMNHDTFRGEYLCFESRALNVYEMRREETAKTERKRKRKYRRRKT